VEDAAKAVKEGAEGVISEVDGEWNIKGAFASYEWW
jgi:hypothetical protein